MTPYSDPSERSLAASYDASPYAGRPFSYTHPGLLAAYGRLYGLTPQQPMQCRVLELGCGDGSNIVPMAHELPDSQFVGIDLSPVQIESGRNTAEAVGLTNIRLQARSIMDLDDADGRFDYIIAHGVYSWIPDAVKKKILAICRDHLSPQGVAYISYNVLPGWQFNRSMRDLMLYRTRGMQSPKERADAALDIVHTMLACTEKSNAIHDVERRFFFKGLQEFANDPGYLMHEYLEADNHPFYFHEFAEVLGDHDLQYICDAEQAAYELDRLPADAAGKLEAIATTPLDLEQYIDFVNNTRFRRSLICHTGIELDSNYRFERMADLFATTTAIPLLDKPGDSVAQATAFKTTGGRSFSTPHPLALAVLRKLCGIRPCTLHLTRLTDDLTATMLPDPDPDSRPLNEQIGQVLYSLFFNGAVDLLAAPRSCTLSIGERPVASPLSRLMAPSRRVTNMCHHTITIDDDLACLVLSLLDGSRDRETLVDRMLDAVRNGRVTSPEHDGQPAVATRDAMHAQLDTMLRYFSRCGVLIA